MSPIPMSIEPERPKRPTSGFTLIELLVAMTIFAVLSTAMYTVFAGYQQTKEITDRDARRLAELQRFFSQFGREIQQVVARPVRDEMGGETRQPALIGTFNTLEFTRAGWNQPPFATTLRGELQRVGYGMEEGKLVRLQWNLPDRVEQEPSYRSVALENVAEVSFRYFGFDDDRKINESEAWPLQSADQGGGEATYWPAPATDVALPAMVQITLDLPDIGKISRSYALVREHNGS